MMHDIMLMVHFIGLIMGVGNGFAFLYLKKVSSDLEPAEKEKFMLRVLPVSMMGKIGLTLLIISGGYLMTPYWSTLGTNHILLTKMVLVVILIVLFGMVSVYGKKAKANNGGEYLAKMGSMGRLTLITALLTVVFAVLNFH